MNENALEVCELQKRFKEFTLKDVSFALPKGYIMGLVGKNGAGKTTIINLMLELLHKEEGTITILGKDIKECIAIKQDISVVFDDVFFVDTWTLRDVEFAIAPFYHQWDSKKYHAYLKEFSLSPSKKVKELSKGMKMKLMLAVALSHNAKLLILDEPTSGLDPVARDELLDILLHYIEDENNSVLFSTHITSDLDKIADYLTIVDDGKVFYTGSKDELFEKYCMVRGGLDTLSPEIETKFIGIQKGHTGFSALIHMLDMKYVCKDMITEKATIDDILIHIHIANQGGNAYDNH